ncbi:hypothetical protein BJX63DRAFT_132855 [Aspergillus granulosus]|uniref:Uncharacterized protein n=1 Tax=Aspergillus granulosus TaxID=176169 RepID=A0ABR4GT61_9EURO
MLNLCCLCPFCRYITAVHGIRRPRSYSTVSPNIAMKQQRYSCTQQWELPIKKRQRKKKRLRVVGASNGRRLRQARVRKRGGQCSLRGATWWRLGARKLIKSHLGPGVSWCRCWAIDCSGSVVLKPSFTLPPQSRQCSVLVRSYPATP